MRARSKLYLVATSASAPYGRTDVGPYVLESLRAFAMQFDTNMRKLDGRVLAAPAPAVMPRTIVVAQRVD